MNNKTEKIKENESVIMQENTKPLLPKQLETIESLIIGMDDDQIAKKIGVEIQVIKSWKSQDIEFKKSLDAKRREIWERYKDSIRSLIDIAIENIKEVLLKGEEKTKLDLSKYLILQVSSKKYLEPKNELQDYLDELSRIAFK